MSFEDKIQKELDNLNNERDLVDLEAFILDGVSTEIPIVIDYPLPNGETQPLSAKVRPLTSNEWNNCVRVAMKFDKSMQLLVVEKGLLDKDGETFPSDLISKMPTGVVDSLYLKISDVSGVKQDKKEQMEMAKELMGF